MSDQAFGGRRPGGFSTTHWSVILAAGDSQSPDSRQALERLCQTYWYPVYAYIRRRGCDPEAARDLAQGFFAQLLEKKYIKVARPERGRFRSFLLTSVKNYLHNEWDRTRAQKRGGGKVPVALDFENGERHYRVEPADPQTPEKIFERRWALTLLDHTLEQLKKEMTEAGHQNRFHALKVFLTGESVGIPYKQCAARLNMTEGAVKVAVHRMRRQFGALLRAKVAETVENSEEIEDEIRHLLSALAG